MFGSDEYFALLKQNPKLGSYFALGERVVVVFEGRVYRVKVTTALPLRKMCYCIRMSTKS